MSRHGRSPGEPYGSGPGSGEYGPPSDPWGQVPDAGGNRPAPYRGPPASPPRPGYGELPPAGPGYGEPRSTGYPAPLERPPAPRRNLALYVVVAVLVLLAAAGVGYALFLLSGDGEPGARGTPAPAVTGTATPDPSASPGDNIGLSAAVARVDDCLVNEGSTEQTQMRIVRCDEPDPDAVVYRVLAVVNEQVEGEDDGARHASAQAICADIEGYTHHYYEIGGQNSFVLCMAQLG